MDTCGWIKNDHREMRIYQSLYFQMAFKMYHISNHDNVARKLKYTTGIHQNKIELEKNI